MSSFVHTGGGLDTSDATATADKILSGYTAYAGGEKITGTFSTDAGFLWLYSNLGKIVFQGQFTETNHTGNGTPTVQSTLYTPICSTSASSIKIVWYLYRDSNSGTNTWMDVTILGQTLRVSGVGDPSSINRTQVIAIPSGTSNAQWTSQIRGSNASTGFYYYITLLGFTALDGTYYGS